MTARGGAPALALVWFKRDLRVTDHRPLAEAAARGPVVGVYVHEPGIEGAPDSDARHLRFINQSLDELRARLEAMGTTLVELEGELPEAFDRLHAALPFDIIWAYEETANGRTYARDRRVRAWARAKGIRLHERPSNGVVRRLPSRDGWAAQWQARMQARVVPTPERVAAPPPSALLAVPPELRHFRPPEPAVAPFLAGGEARAHALLRSFLTERGEDYRRAMSSPVTAETQCSRLSPYLAFGNLSVRLAYRAARRRMRELKAAEPTATNRRWLASMRSFQSRLAWHCHFIQKLEDEPAIEYRCFSPLYETLRPHEPDAARLDAWTHGRTGYPLVDACMRALRETGWLTFRMRAMVQSFASYHLWLDWRATGLVLARWFLDYEPGIHWSQCQMQSGTTGINAIRIYNPYLQAERLDPGGIFVRRWVPELAPLSGPDLVRPERVPFLLQQMGGVVIGRDYPAPIVEHETAYRAAQARMHAFRQRPDVQADARRVYQRHGSRDRPLGRPDR